MKENIEVLDYQFMIFVIAIILPLVSKKSERPFKIQNVVQQSCCKPWMSCVQTYELEAHRRTVGHIPLELSRFVYHFLVRGGTLSGHVLSTSYKRSLIGR